MREAIGLAFDFEWTNKNVMYGAYARTVSPFQNSDMVAEGETPPDDPTAASGTLTPWARAGCTWWLETRWEIDKADPESMALVRDRLAAGPPVAAGG